MEARQKLVTAFQGVFKNNSKENIRVFFAPGRVNLIGEHTDYNGGYVFPAALTIGTYMAVRPREDGYFQLASSSFRQQVSFHQTDLTYKEEDDWGNYPKGVLFELQKQGITLGGADIYYLGHIPNGAGLSSSASIGMVTAYGFAQLLEADISKVELAKLCQRMENQFIGVNSGIMDQFAVGLGKKDYALFLNTSNLQYEAVPLQLGAYKIVVTNTNKRRGLADSKYNERRAECERGLEFLQQAGAEIDSLGELSLARFSELADTIQDDTVKRRVEHVVSEDERVLQAVDALKAGDLPVFGQLMKASHESLRDDYEVTGLELDTLYELQKAAPGCIGTRMTGAGFGGCTVSLVKDDHVEAFCQTVETQYVQRIGYPPSFYLSEAGDGVKEIAGRG